MELAEHGLFFEGLLVNILVVQRKGLDATITILGGQLHLAVDAVRVLPQVFIRETDENKQTTTTND